MNVQLLLHEIEALPLEKQEEVADFIELLQSRLRTESKNAAASASAKQAASEFVPSAFSSSMPAAPLEFFGMWADRDDMKDSLACVRDLREREWRISRV